MEKVMLIYRLFNWLYHIKVVAIFIKLKFTLIQDNRLIGMFIRFNCPFDMWIKSREFIVKFRLKADYW